MSLKDLFVQEVDTGEDDIDLNSLAQGLENIPTEPEYNQVEVEDATEVNNFVSEAYENNNLSDFSKSIFKVEEIRNNLPNEMPTATKLTTVKAMLSTFNLTESELISDGEDRLSCLKSVDDQLTLSLNEEISAYEQEIEELKLQIADKESKIATNRSIIADTNTIVKMESSRIEELLKFIKGE